MCNLKRTHYLQFLLLVILIMAFFSPLWSITTTMIYESRDILRAQQVAAGNFIFYGPETSGGGFLPGGFYYYLTSIPLALGFSWHGIWWQMILLLGVGVAGIWAYFKKHLGWTAANSVVLLIMSSIYVNASVRLFVNPSFTPAFVILFLICIIESFPLEKSSHGKRRNAWLIACLIMALAVQIHFTVLFLIPPVLIFNLLAPRFGIERLSIKSLLQGLTLFISVLLPFTVWFWLRERGTTLGVDPHSIQGEASTAYQFLLRQLPYEFRRFNTSQFFERLSAFLLIPQMLAYAIGTGVNQFVERSAGASSSIQWSPRIRSLLLFFGLCSAFAALPSCYALIATWSVRYSLLFSLCYPLFLGILIHSFELKYRTVNQLRRALLVGLVFAVLTLRRTSMAEFLVSFHTFGTSAAILGFAGILFLSVSFRQLGMSLVRALGVGFIFVAVVTAFEWQNYRIQFHSDELMSLDEGQKAADLIYEKTGWGFAEARNHIHLINVDSEISIRPYWFNLPQKNPLPQSQIDGFIVGLINQNPPAADAIDPVVWLKENRLEASIHAAIVKGDIKLLPALREDRLFILPYVFSSPSFRIDVLQNRGLTYEGEKFETIAQPNIRSFKAEFNNCPNKAAWCKVQVDVEQQNVGGKYALFMRVRGMSLSQTIEWVIPDWTEGLRDPTLEMNCHGKPASIVVAHSLGFSYDGDSWTQNHSVIAPFEKTVPDPCDGSPPENLRFRYALSYVSERSVYYQLPATEFAFKENAK